MNAVRSAPVNWEDRRSEARLKANGTVTLRLNEEYQVPFDARLMDISASGFRVRHANTELHSGQECDFTLPGTRGKAKVVWNRTTPDFIETGFFILIHDTA
ncbi:MAG: PilZ domain-containing protein [Acidobacteria bacterium]|nr:PilZ domain-containing protein [Acidobacteriota bacterium]